MKHGMLKKYKLSNSEAVSIGSVNIKCSAVLPDALAFVNNGYIIVGNNGNVLRIDD